MDWEAGGRKGENRSERQAGNDRPRSLDGERETALSCCQEQGAQGTKRLLCAVGGPGPVKDVSVSGMESAGEHPNG